MKTEWRWVEDRGTWFRDLGPLRAEVLNVGDGWFWNVGEPFRVGVRNTVVCDIIRTHATPDAAKSAAEEAVRRFAAEIMEAL